MLSNYKTIQRASSVTKTKQFDYLAIRLLIRYSYIEWTLLTVYKILNNL